MATRHHLQILSGTLGFVVLLTTATQSAEAPLPWAATNGLHFVEAVINADNYRAAASGLAIKKSASPDVRAFARMLWVDSLEDTRRLKWALTKTEFYVVLPSQVSTHYMFVIDRLLPVSGDDFDQRFIAQQRASLSEALALAQAYARWGDDFRLKDYAAHSVPEIQRQLDQIREVDARRQALALR